MHMDPELRKNQSSELPLGRFSKPWEQAGQVVYFLSKYSSCKFSLWTVSCSRPVRRCRTVELTNPTHSSTDQTGSSAYVDGVSPPSCLVASNRARKLTPRLLSQGYLIW